METLDGRAHSEWEFGKFTGDLDAAHAVLDTCGEVQHPPAEQFDPWKDSTLWFRPADLAALDRVRWPSVNGERWAQLADILRNEPDYWLRMD